MRMLSTTLGTLALAAALLGGSATGSAGVAHATTGPSVDLPTTFRVPGKFAAQFLGQYILKSVPAAAHIQSAAMGIEVSDKGFLHGVGQFYGYNTSGSQSSWVATLYHFHQIGKAQMTLDLLAPAGNGVLLGRLLVAPPQRELLNGTITLSGHSYPVVFHRISKR